jgi:Phage integrase family
MGSTVQAERDRVLGEIILNHEVPQVRKVLQLKLGFYISQSGANPYHPDAEDIFQEITTKLVQHLNNLLSDPNKNRIENFRQKDAGIGNFRFHDLRHTAGTRLAEAGADAFTIKDILGHASIQTSAIYVHATDEGKRRSLAALGRSVEIHGHKLGTNEKEQIE